MSTAIVRTCNGLRRELDGETFYFAVAEYSVGFAPRRKAAALPSCIFRQGTPSQLSKSLEGPTSLLPKHSSPSQTRRSKPHGHQTGLQEIKGNKIKSIGRN